MLGSSKRRIKSKPKKLSAHEPAIFEDNDFVFGHLSGFVPLPGKIEHIDPTKVVVCFYGCSRNEINAIGESDADKIHAVMEDEKPAPTNNMDNPIIAGERTPSVCETAAALTEAVAKTADAAIAAMETVIIAEATAAAGTAAAETAAAGTAAAGTAAAAETAAAGTAAETAAVGTAAETAAAAAAAAETAAVVVVKEDTAAGVTVSDVEKVPETAAVVVVEEDTAAGVTVSDVEKVPETAAVVVVEEDTAAGVTVSDVEKVPETAAVVVVEEDTAAGVTVSDVEKVPETAAVVVVEEDTAAGVTVSDVEKVPEQLPSVLVNDAEDAKDDGAVNVEVTVSGEEKPEELLLAPVNDAVPVAAAVAEDAAEANVLAVAAEEEQVNEANVVVAVIPAPQPPPPQVYAIKCKRITRRRLPVNDREPFISIFGIIRPKRIVERRKRVEEIDPPVERPRAKLVAEIVPLFRPRAKAFYRPISFGPFSVPAVNRPKTNETKKQQHDGKISVFGQSRPKVAVAAVSSGKMVKKLNQFGKKQPSEQQKLPDVNKGVAKIAAASPLCGALGEKRKLVAKCTTTVNQDINGVEPVSIAVTASTSLSAVDVAKKRKCVPSEQQAMPAVQQAAVVVAVATAAITMSTVDTITKRKRMAKKRPSVQPEIPDVIQEAVASVSSTGEVVEKRKRLDKKQPSVQQKISHVDQAVDPPLSCVDAIKKRTRIARKRPSVQQEIAYVVKVKKSKNFKRKWSRAQATVDQGNGKKPARLMEIPAAELKQCKRIRPAPAPKRNDKIRKPTVMYARVTKSSRSGRAKRPAKPTNVKYDFCAQTNQIFTSNDLRTTNHETINHTGRILKAKPYPQIPMNNEMNENNLPSLELTIFPEPENEMFSYLNIQTKDPKLQCEQQLIKLHGKVREMLNGYLQHPEQYINLLTIYKNLPLTPLILKKNPHCLETMYKLRNYCGNIKMWRYNKYENQTENHIEFRAQIYCTLSLTNEIYQLLKGLFNYPKNLRFWDEFQADVAKFRKNICNLSAFELKYLVDEPPNIDDDNVDNKMDDNGKLALINDDGM